MCEELTLTAYRREVIATRIAANKEVIAANTKLKKSLTSARSRLSQLEQDIADVLLPNLSEYDNEILQKLMSGAEEALRIFLSVLQAFNTTGVALQASVKSVLRFMDEVVEGLTIPAKAQEIVNKSAEFPSDCNGSRISLT